jgi:hypothetical protein
MRSIALSLAVLLSTPAVARAEDTKPKQWEPGRRTTSKLPTEVDADAEASAGDGVYGRFDGLFDIGLELGAAFDSSATSGAALASIHYMYMAGVYAGYADAFGGDAAARARTVSFGVDMRPAFIPRWSNNLQSGSSLTDLVIDSISFGVGAYFAQPQGGSLGDRKGLELSLGVGIPLMGRVDGAWLGARGYLRWDDPGVSSAPPAEVVGLATLGFHFMVGGG